ncbi:MAG: hypothetical protein D6788_02055 [Planctomycetota bacterium]|nr:MAG: hypothetical protein D6788_02055 [Planctomycetota bacterium]
MVTFQFVLQNGQAARVVPCAGGDVQAGLLPVAPLRRASRRGTLPDPPFPVNIGPELLKYRVFDVSILKITIKYEKIT